MIKTPLSTSEYHRRCVLKLLAWKFIFFSQNFFILYRSKWNFWWIFRSQRKKQYFLLILRNNWPKNRIFLDSLQILSNFSILTGFWSIYINENRSSGAPEMVNVPPEIVIIPPELLIFNLNLYIITRFNRFSPELILSHHK